jgi:hypothetical protein
MVHLALPSIMIGLVVGLAACGSQVATTPPLEALRSLRSLLHPLRHRFQLAIPPPPDSTQPVRMHVPSCWLTKSWSASVGVPPGTQPAI